MGRGRGKGRKQTTLATREDLGIGEEEKIQPSRRRGRPTKAQLRAEMEEREEAMEKLELEEDEEDGETKNSNTDVKDQALAENGQKRKRSSPLKENPDSVKDEIGAGEEIQIDGAVASLGFRQNGSRRKNKPRRAAEVGVEC